MTFFEYAMVMVSIMLGIGLSQLLGAVGDVILSPRRYWPHALWIAGVSFLMIQAWWAYWDMHQGVDWTFGLYGFVLLGPALAIAAANVLVPAGRDVDMDWRAHFQNARPGFFSLLTVFHLFGICFTWLVMNVPLLIPLRAAQLFFVAMALTGLAFRSEVIHRVLPVIYIVAIAVFSTLFRAYPAAFGLAG